MPIVILSPYSGRPVKIRDQDIQRAVRDEENRVFYVLPRSDGQGHYSAITRQGGEKDEARYLKIQEKLDLNDAHKQTQATPQAIHNAAGKRRSGSKGKMVIIGFTLIIAALAWWAYQHKDQWTQGPPAGDVYMDTPPGSAPGSAPESVSAPGSAPQTPAQ